MTDKELRELDAWVFERFGILAAPTNPAAAMQVLEKCVKVVNAEFVWMANANQWRIVWYQGFENFTTVEAETLPLAIAKFAKQLFSK